MLPTSRFSSLTILPLVLVRPQRRINRRYCSVTYRAGAYAASVLFKKPAQARAPRPGMTDTATSQGLGDALILNRLIIIRGLARWDHGMGAAVAARAVEATVPFRVAVERDSRVDFRHAGVTSCAFGFAHPRNTATARNARCNRCQAAVTGRAVAVSGCVLDTPVALGGCPGMTVIARGRGRNCCMPAVNCLGKIFVRARSL